jgi:hypothetical protein
MHNDIEILAIEMKRAGPRLVNAGGKEVPCIEVRTTPARSRRAC